jgi:hypothetical protein
LRSSINNNMLKTATTTAEAAAATTTMNDNATAIKNDDSSSMAGPTYELGIADDGSQVVWIDGAFKAGESDLNIFRKCIWGGLKSKIPAGKKAIADGGYTGEHPSI